MAETNTEALYEVHESAASEDLPSYGRPLDIARIPASENAQLVDAAVDGDFISRWHSGLQKS